MHDRPVAVHSAFVDRRHSEAKRAVGEVQCIAANYTIDRKSCFLSYQVLRMLNVKRRVTVPSNAMQMLWNAAGTKETLCSAATKTKNKEIHGPWKRDIPRRHQQRPRLENSLTSYSHRVAAATAASRVSSSSKRYFMESAGEWFLGLRRRAGDDSASGLTLLSRACSLGLRRSVSG